MDSTQLKKIRNGSVGDSVVKSAAVFVSCLLVLSMVLSGFAVAPVSAQENDTQACEVGPRVPAETQEKEESDELEVMLTNDVSGSMGDGTKLDDSKTASNAFIDNLEEPDEVGLTTFSDEITLESPLTTDYDAVKEDVDGMSAVGSTDAKEGIITSRDELLDGDNATDGANKVMIVIGDDQTDTPDEAIDSAQAAKDEGIIIYSIGLETDESTYLEEIASGEDRYYESPNSSELESIYEEIGTDIEEDLQSEITVETRNLFKPGNTHEYTVRQETSNGSQDITDEADVNTTNNTLLSVDESDKTLTAADNPNTSDWVRVDAEYEDESGCTNVIVSEPRVESLELLPVLSKVNAVLTDDTILFILLSTMMGIVATRATSPFAGVGAVNLGMILGWFLGYVATGMMLVATFATLFIGLNLAANIDYSVRR